MIESDDLTNNETVGEKATVVAWNQIRARTTAKREDELEGR